MAKKSQTSGDRKFGQICRSLGYGISQKKSHGRPRWMIGNIAPIISAKTVIDFGAARDRPPPRALTRRRIAEISVPAWLMPIQNTKFVMSNAQKTGQLRPQTPIPQYTWYDATTPTPSRHDAAEERRRAR